MWGSSRRIQVFYVIPGFGVVRPIRSTNGSLPSKPPYKPINRESKTHITFAVLSPKSSLSKRNRKRVKKTNKYLFWVGIIQIVQQKMKKKDVMIFLIAFADLNNLLLVLQPQFVDLYLDY